MTSFKIDVITKTSLVNIEIEEREINNNKKNFGITYTSAIFRIIFVLLFFILYKNFVYYSSFPPTRQVLLLRLSVFFFFLSQSSIGHIPSHTIHSLFLRLAPFSLPSAVYFNIIFPLSLNCHSFYMPEPF